MLARLVGLAALTLVAIGSTAASMSADVELPRIAVATRAQLTMPVTRATSAPAFACAIDLAKEFASATHHGVSAGGAELGTVASLGCKSLETRKNAPSVWSAVWSVVREAASHLFQALAYAFRM
jgi:hypothetical protein